MLKSDQKHCRTMKLLKKSIISVTTKLTLLKALKFDFMESMSGHVNRWDPSWFQMWKKKDICSSSSESARIVLKVPEIESSAFSASKLLSKNVFNFLNKNRSKKLENEDNSWDRDELNDAFGFFQFIFFEKLWLLFWRSEKKNPLYANA